MNAADQAAVARLLAEQHRAAVARCLDAWIARTPRPDDVLTPHGNKVATW